MQFEHNLTKTEVTYGLISVSGIRDYFPPPNEKIVVYNDEGKQYITKMHSSAARIDGLTDWYSSLPAQIGDTVTIVIFEEIDGIPLCAKEHRPGIACGGFNSKIEQTTPKTATKRENNHHRKNFHNKNTHST